MVCNVMSMNLRKYFALNALCDHSLWAPIVIPSAAAIATNSAETYYISNIRCYIKKHIKQSEKSFTREFTSEALAIKVDKVYYPVVETGPLLLFF